MKVGKKQDVTPVMHDPGDVHLPFNDLDIKVGKRQDVTPVMH
jgi:hypothetical protein